MNFEPLKQYILNELDQKLASDLFYHSVSHTLDVLEMCIRIANEEGVGENDLLLLKSAALLHDFGFVDTYRGHEERSCEYAAQILPYYDYMAYEIELIQGMIMKTKIPQQPETHLERILCDADLDYLGRTDFWPISDNLFQELITRSFVSNKNEWNKIQVRFIGAHQYWTDTNIRDRETPKQDRLVEIKSLIIEEEPTDNLG